MDDAAVADEAAAFWDRNDFAKWRDTVLQWHGRQLTRLIRAIAAAGLRGTLTADDVKVNVAARAIRLCVMRWLATPAHCRPRPNVLLVQPRDRVLMGE